MEHRRERKECDRKERKDRDVRKMLVRKKRYKRPRIGGTIRKGRSV
jgi:hypothetical protein